MIRTYARRGLTSTQTTWLIIGIVAGALLLTCVGVVAIGAGIMLPALGKARQSAMGMKSASQLQQVEQAYQIATSNSNVAIESPQDLIDNGYFTPQLIQSPFGPVGDGGNDYWITFDRPAPDEIDAPERYIVSYDRAMYAGQPNVAACVLDGACEPLEFQKFQSLLNDPVNADRAFNLPERQKN